MGSFEGDGNLADTYAGQNSLGKQIKLLQSQIERFTRVYNLEKYKTNKYIIGLFGTDEQLMTAYSEKYTDKTLKEIRQMVAQERAAIKERIPKAVTTLQVALNTLCANTSYYTEYGKLIDPLELFAVMLQESSLNPRTGGSAEEGYFQLMSADAVAGGDNATMKADSILAHHGVRQGSQQDETVQLTMKGITFFLHNKQQTLKDIASYGAAVAFTEPQKQQLCYFTYNKWKTRLTTIINHLKKKHKPVNFEHIKMFLYEKSWIKNLAEENRVYFSQFFNDPYSQYGLNRDVSTRDFVSGMTPYQASVGLNYMIHVDALKQGIALGVSQPVEVQKNFELQQGIHFVRSSYKSPFSMIKALYGEDLASSWKTVMHMIDTLTVKWISLKQGEVTYEPESIPDIKKLWILFIGQ